MSDLLWVIFGAFASWRLASLIYEDQITKPLRYLLGERRTLVEVEKPTLIGGSLVMQPMAAEQITYTDTFTGHLIQCFRCVSVWTSAAVVILYYVAPPAILWLGLSGMAIVIREHWKV